MTLCVRYFSQYYVLCYLKYYLFANICSDSDEPPPLEDIVERPTLQQQYADFFELLIGDAHANNDEGNQGNGDDGSDQYVFA